MNRLFLYFKLCVIFIMAFSSTAKAQYTDTLSVMHYNILNYRNYFNECNDTSNNASNKEIQLAKIIAYIDADILSFNEVQADQSSFDSLFNNLGLAGEYGMAPFSGNGFLANALFYRKSKVRYYYHDSISLDLNSNPLVRQIDLHILYHNNTAALQNSDTTFMAVYVAHYKAGSSVADLSQRKAMSASLMAYHESHYKSFNYIICGDFNTRSSSEEAYQLLVNSSNSTVQFNDPINQFGAWNSNSNFAEIHTQSTRSSETNEGCFSAGGLDDRFDFILVGNEIISNSRKVHYLPGSYKTIGNDGAHFNKDIKSPANSSVPFEILNALYEVSDHLPVYLELVISSSFSAVKSPELQIYIANPVQNELQIGVNASLIHSIKVYNSLGALAMGFENIQVSSGRTTLNCSKLSNGLYFIEMKIGDEFMRKKIIIDKK